MNFLEAVKELKEGRCVGIKRKIWTKDDYFIATRFGEIRHRDAGTVDHLQDNILATDWELVPRPKVKKTLKGWIVPEVIRQTGMAFSGELIMGMTIYPSKESAKISYSDAEATYFEHTYEVEE